MKKIGLFLFIFLTAAFTLSAQVVDSLMNEAKRLVVEKQEDQALAKYKAVTYMDSDNIQALTQASILSTREGKRQKVKKAKQTSFNEARAFAEAALRKNPNDAEANVAMATAIDQLAMFSGAKDKISLLRDVKTYTDKALLIDSSDPKAWHILGLWNMRFSTLNFAERTATKLLFGGMPDVSLDKAIADFEKCRSLQPNFILNYYHLAKAYHANEKDLKAIAVLKQVIRLRPILQDDQKIQQECHALLEKLQ